MDQEGQGKVSPKGKGYGIMVSDFIEEHGSYLCLSVVRLADARRENRGVFPRQATVLLEHHRDGY